MGSIFSCITHCLTAEYAPPPHASRGLQVHTNTFSLRSTRLWQSADTLLWYWTCTLTFADTGAVHHPDERWAEFTVCGDAVLSGLEYVSVVLLHLSQAVEQRIINLQWGCRRLAVSDDEDRLTMSVSFFLRFLRSGLATCCNKNRQNSTCFWYIWSLQLEKIFTCLTLLHNPKGDDCETFI